MNGAKTVRYIPGNPHGPRNGGFAYIGVDSGGNLRISVDDGGVLISSGGNSLENAELARIAFYGATPRAHIELAELRLSP